MRSNAAPKKGFTLVELMLAMAFFSSILFVSAATFVQLLGIYNKGVAVKQMNQAGRTLTDNFIRNANQGSYTTNSLNVVRDKDDDPTGKVQCISLGSTMYLLSYAKDEPDRGVTDGAYRFRDTQNPVNFVRYNNAETPTDGCPNPNDLIDPELVSPLLNETLRVYHTEVTPLTSGLVRFSLKIGTFAGVGADTNAQIDTSPPFAMSCPIDSIGNFCAFSEYETILYLPNMREE